MTTTFMASKGCEAIHKKDAPLNLASLSITERGKKKCLKKSMLHADDCGMVIYNHAH